MAKEICISSTPHETRLAILEDDQLAEIYYERENEYTLAGSIYNGRVTRVLPGMQSAFVDVGLERDAFLYVTDFLELEDPEETDELEKAAATGGNKPPREVRHTNVPEAPVQAARSGGRPEDRTPRPTPKPEQKQEQRQERPAQDRPIQARRMTVEAIPEPGDEIAAIPESQLIAEQAEYAQDESGPGAKRWRGRRRRRGGRGGSGSAEGQAETSDSSEMLEEPVAEVESAPQIQAATSFTPAPHMDRAPAEVAPFVLPGESLSKYGGTPADDATSASEAATPVRPASTFKPSTLIEVPLEWDGSGLLPGESLSKHRRRPAEAEVEVNPEPHGVFSDMPGAEAADAIEEEAFVEEMTESEPESAPEAPEFVAPAGPGEEAEDEEAEEFDLVEETVDAAQAAKADQHKTVPVKTDDYTVETVIEGRDHCLDGVVGRTGTASCAAWTVEFLRFLILCFFAGRGDRGSGSRFRHLHVPRLRRHVGKDAVRSGFTSTSASAARLCFDNEIRQEGIPLPSEFEGTSNQRRRLESATMAGMSFQPVCAPDSDGGLAWQIRQVPRFLGVLA